MTVTTLDNKVWSLGEIIPKMHDDQFYYGYLGKYALSSSAFKAILNDWDKFIKDLGVVSDGKESQALRDGRLIHLCALEPHRIKDMHIVESTKGSNVFKLSVSQYGSHCVYTSRELDRCRSLANNVIRDFDAFTLMEDAEFEIPGIGYSNGLPVRVKADIKKGDHIIDLKTTSDASRFEESIDKWGYDLQGALYLQVFKAKRFSFIILDKRTGEVTTRELTPTELTRGRQKLLLAANTFKMYIDEYYEAIKDGGE